MVRTLSRRVIGSTPVRRQARSGLCPGPVQGRWAAPPLERLSRGGALHHGRHDLGHQGVVSARQCREPVQPTSSRPCPPQSSRHRSWGHLPNPLHVGAQTITGTGGLAGLQLERITQGSYNASGSTGWVHAMGARATSTPWMAHRRSQPRSKGLPWPWRVTWRPGAHRSARTWLPRRCFTSPAAG